MNIIRSGMLHSSLRIIALIPKTTASMNIAVESKTTAPTLYGEAVDPVSNLVISIVNSAEPQTNK